MKRIDETDRLQSLIDRCFRLADEARRRGDTPVGSLLVGADGEIVAEASERNRTEDLFAHAELLAIEAAVKLLQNNDLKGFTLVTTNEPCFLCSYAVRQTRISRVIFAIETLGTGGYSSNYPILAADDIGHWGPAPEILKATELLPPNAK
ncbi:MAG: nucleoside deaminase [Pyrinomonadaceae bacterium]